MSIKRTKVYTNRSSFPSEFYESSSTMTVSGQTSVIIPSCDLDIGGMSCRLGRSKTLSVNSDASWDFGQSIGTWQAGHEYSVGDWVRPTSGSSIWDGANNSSTSYATTLMATNVLPGPEVSSADSFNVHGSYYAFNRNIAWGGIPAWNSGNTSFPHWLKYDFGTPKCINKLRYFGTLGYSPKRWKFQGSNIASPSTSDNADWITLLDNTGADVADPGNDWTPYFTFSNHYAYRHYRVYITSGHFNGNYVLINELHLVAAPILSYKCTSAGTSLSSEPTWGTTVGGTTAESGGPTWTCYYDYTTATNRAGTDFYVYACQPTSGTTPTLLLSANSTYPHGYTASNSRKIGGFHGLCGSVGTIANHPLTGYLTGDVLPQSVWCLKHRAKAASNVGLVYIPPIESWCSIYLTSGIKTDPTIRFNGTILDTITYFEANDAARLLKMRMPRDSEFAVLASGSNEGTNILGSADPVTVTAAVDTAGRRMISNYGVEGCAGIMWQWLSELSYRFDNTTSADTGYTAVPHTHNVTVTEDAGSFTSGNASVDVAPAWNWKNKTGGKGQIYSQGTYGGVGIGAGANFDKGVYCGSLSRIPDRYYWVESTAVSFRLITSTIEK